MEGTSEVEEDNQPDMISYESNDFGVSFKYPSSFTATRQESLGDGYLEIDSGYVIENGGITYPLLMTIGKKGATEGARESIEEFKKWSEEMGYSIISIDSKEGYDIIKISDREYYLLTDKGTYFVSDNANEINGNFIPKEELKKYQIMFDDIRDSIRIP